jgi:hypothetical protein
MEKYNGIKTIGDGTYGSVVKAMNMKTGNYIIHYLSEVLYRRDCCNKKNEKEIL